MLNIQFSETYNLPMKHLHFLEPNGQQRQREVLQESQVQDRFRSSPSIAGNGNEPGPDPEAR